jgi:hypothetical protein
MSNDVAARVSNGAHGSRIDPQRRVSRLGAASLRLFPSMAMTVPARPVPEWAEVHRELRSQG